MVFYSRTPAGTGVGDEDEVFAGHMSFINEQHARRREYISGPIRR
jgi:hypothetical protein